MKLGERARLREIALRPGVNGVDLWPDCIEVSGSPEDSDDLAGQIMGAFEPEEVKDAVPWLPFRDCRDNPFCPPDRV